MIWRLIPRSPHPLTHSHDLAKLCLDSLHLRWVAWLNVHGFLLSYNASVKGSTSEGVRKLLREIWPIFVVPVLAIGYALWAHGDMSAGLWFSGMWLGFWAAVMVIGFLCISVHDAIKRKS